jgi:hypothetical protein
VLISRIPEAKSIGLLNVRLIGFYGKNSILDGFVLIVVRGVDPLPPNLLIDVEIISGAVSAVRIRRPAADFRKRVRRFGEIAFGFGV